MVRRNASVALARPCLARPDDEPRNRNWSPPSPGRPHGVPERQVESEISRESFFFLSMKMNGAVWVLHVEPFEGVMQMMTLRPALSKPGNVASDALFLSTRPGQGATVEISILDVL